MHETLADAYFHGDLLKTEVEFGFFLELFAAFRLSPHNLGNDELARELLNCDTQIPKLAMRFENITPTVVPVVIITTRRENKMFSLLHELTRFKIVADTRPKQDSIRCTHHLPNQTLIIFSLLRGSG
jgi:hypothetical protein